MARAPPPPPRQAQRPRSSYFVEPFGSILRSRYDMNLPAESRPEGPPTHSPKSSEMGVAQTTHSPHSAARAPRASFVPFHTASVTTCIATVVDLPNMRAPSFATFSYF